MPFKSGQPKAHRLAVYADYDSEAQMCQLKAVEPLIERPTRFSLVEVWGYDHGKRSWFRSSLGAIAPQLLERKARALYSSKTDPVIHRLGKEHRLYWVKWKEERGAYASLAFCSPHKCQDVMIGPPRKGDVIAACVPEAGAAYIPDPEVYCR